MKSSINSQLGAAIKYQRENKLRITQEEFAKRLGISRPSVTNIEAGRQQLTVVQLVLFSRALGVSPVDLIPDGRPLGPQVPLSTKLPDSVDATIREWADRLAPGNV